MLRLIECKPLGVAETEVSMTLVLGDTRTWRDLEARKIAMPPRDHLTVHVT